MRIKATLPAIIAITTSLTACSSVFTTGRAIQLDIQPDSQTELTFTGDVYPLRYQDADGLMAMAKEQKESFYWPSLPTPEMDERLAELEREGKKLPWHPHQSKPDRPVPEFVTPSIDKLQGALDDVYGGFAAYQQAYRKEHPGTTKIVGCLTDQPLCEQYVTPSARVRLAKYRNVYNQEMLALQLGHLGHVELTNDESGSYVRETDAPFVMVVGSFWVESLSRANAKTLFGGSSLAAEFDRYPCVYLIGVHGGEPLTLRRKTTAFCGFKQYSGLAIISRYLKKHSGERGAAD